MSRPGARAPARASAGERTAQPGAPAAFADRFLLGVNYWSRAGGPRMWERFDPAVVREELQAMRSMGLDCCRPFAFVPSFMPAPPAVIPAPLERLRAFARLAEEEGVDLLPTALVGHMSGENFGFPGQGARSLWEDPELLAWQRALIEALLDATADSPSVLGWILSNEMPLWAGRAKAEVIGRWCEELTGAIRARDPRPVGAGDGLGASSPAAAIAPHVDWLGAHVYYGDVDPLRQALQTDLRLRRAARHGRPVILEEFGCSTTQAGEAEQAAYVRDSVLAAIGVGARGALCWCWSDFDAETIGRERPYSHHAFELGFGLVRADGSEKPVGEELRALRALIDRIHWDRARPGAPRCALLRPRYFDEDHPFSWEDRTALERTFLQAFVLAAQAGLHPVVIGEEDELAPYSLVLVPATQKLHTSTWLRLEEAARDGATVYWSYLSGDHAFHQGAWCPNFEALTGLQHRLRYGCFDLPPVELCLTGDLALQIPTGIDRSAAPYPLARLPIEARSAALRPLLHDGERRPALTEHPLGRGRVLFLCYPIERYLGNLVDGSARGGHRLYQLLGARAGLQPRYPSAHPDVLLRVLEDGRDDLVIEQHRGWSEAVAVRELGAEAELLYQRGAAGADALGPKGARVYRLPSVRP